MQLLERMKEVLDRLLFGKQTMTAAEFFNNCPQVQRFIVRDDDEVEFFFTEDPTEISMTAREFVTGSATRIAMEAVEGLPEGTYIRGEYV